MYHAALNRPRARRRPPDFGCNPTGAGKSGGRSPHRLTGPPTRYNYLVLPQPAAIEMLPFAGNRSQSTPLLAPRF